MLFDVVPKGEYLGVKTECLPDVVDEVDADDVVEGVGGVGLVTGTSGETGWAKPQILIMNSLFATH